MKIKTSDLIGRALDWAVVIAFGWKWKVEKGKIIIARPTKKTYIREPFETLKLSNFPASRNWSFCGPIIEKEWISVRNQDDKWFAQIADDVPDGYHQAEGSTPLIAAMRCYVASKLGDEIEVPDELCNKKGE